jgi:flagellum-specific ATP synthase
VDGDDMNEPIADAVRSILDGHIVLSRDLAHANHYPAIDVLSSVSRLVGEVVTPEVRASGQEVRRLMAAYKEKEDLIAIGAYQHGADRVTDLAIAKRDPINDFLRQRVDEQSSAEEADERLMQLGEEPDTQQLAPDGFEEALQPVRIAPGPSAIPPLHLAV